MNQMYIIEELKTNFGFLFDQGFEIKYKNDEVNYYQVVRLGSPSHKFEILIVFDRGFAGLAIEVFEKKGKVRHGKSYEFDQIIAYLAEKKEYRICSYTFKTLSDNLSAHFSSISDLFNSGNVKNKDDEIRKVKQIY